MVEQEQAHDRRIVVGVDNSAGSAEALRWALAYARQTGGSVEAVTAWQVPAMYAYAYGWTPTGMSKGGGLGGHRGPGRHSDRTPVSQRRRDGASGLTM